MEDGEPLPELSHKLTDLQGVDENQLANNSSSELSYEVQVINSVLLSICLIVIISNIAILCGLVNKKKIKQAHYYLVCNISLADIIVAVSVAIGSLLHMWDISTLLVCNIQSVLIVMSAGCSLTTLLFLNAHNYLRIRNVFQRGGTYSISVYRLMTLGSWIFWLFVGCLGLAFIRKSDTSVCWLGKESYKNSYSWLLLSLGTLLILCLVVFHIALLVLVRNKLPSQGSVRSQPVSGNRTTSRITNSPPNPSASLKVRQDEVDEPMKDSSVEQSLGTIQRPLCKIHNGVNCECRHGEGSVLRSVGNNRVVPTVSLEMTKNLNDRLKSGDHGSTLAASDQQRVSQEHRVKYCRRVTQYHSIVLSIYVSIWVFVALISVIYLQGINPIISEHAGLITSTCMVLTCLLNIAMNYIQ